MEWGAAASYQLKSYPTSFGVADLDIKEDSTACCGCIRTCNTTLME